MEEKTKWLIGIIILILILLILSGKIDLSNIFSVAGNPSPSGSSLAGGGGMS